MKEPAGEDLVNIYDQAFVRAAERGAANKEHKPGRAHELALAAVYRAGVLATQAKAS